jgi:large subunit ribosomal protein L9
MKRAQRLKGDSMKVILHENVIKLGKAGDVVEAAAGYFRNYLQPRKLAVLATAGALKKREEDVAVLQKRAEKAHKEHVALIEKVDALSGITIPVKSGEGGKLYGRVTNKEIAETLAKALDMEIDKRIVKPHGDISALGTYKAAIRFSADAHTEITVTVVPENANAPAAK